MSFPIYQKWKGYIPLPAQRPENFFICIFTFLISSVGLIHSYKAFFIDQKIKAQILKFPGSLNWKRYRFLFLLPFALFAAGHHEKVFTKIYQNGSWDESGFSRSGSQVEVTREYMIFLQDFLKEHEIRSVVDIGCGDWAFSRYLDWEGIDYIGFDVVPYVIERNQRLFSASNITFIYADILNTNLPKADLLLCKDVFQHLSNRDIQKIIQQFPKFKHCLITNYVYPDLSGNNNDIPTGKMHFIDLTKPPFNLKGEKVLHFQSGLTYKQTLHIKKAE
jgi:hypothetical protein